MSDIYNIIGYPTDEQRKAVEKLKAQQKRGTLKIEMAEVYKENQPAVARCEGCNRKWYKWIMYDDVKKEARLSMDQVLMKDLP